MVSRKLLTFSQIEALYSLYNGDDPKKVLTLVHENNHFIYAYTPEITYINGFYITSKDFPLFISNIRLFYQGVGSSAEEAKNNERLSIEIDSIKLPKNKVLFLKPAYKLEQQYFPCLGLIEVRTGQDNWFEGWISPTSYNAIGVQLRQIIKNSSKNSVFPDIMVIYENNIFEFLNVNKNIIISPNRSVYLMGEVLNREIEHLGNQGTIVARELGLPNFGKDLIEVSKHFENAFLMSSENLSSALYFSAVPLKDAITYSIRVFENSRECSTNCVSG